MALFNFSPVQGWIQGGAQGASAPPALKKIVQKDRDTLIKQSLIKQSHDHEVVHT